MDTKDYVNSLLPMLKDKKRSVRVKAFFALGSINETQIPETYKKVYNKVKKEFKTQLDVTSDFVGGRIKKADYNLKKGDLKAAIKGYESALDIDNVNSIVRTNLANLYYRNGEFKKAEQAFVTIIKHEPEYAQTYYSYSLLLAELNRPIEAIEQIKLAIKYMPNNIRFYYNLSLLYDKVNQVEKAESTAAEGLKIDANNESLLYVLAYLYNKRNQKEKAKNIASRLVELYPNNAQYSSFYNQLNRAN